MDELLGGHLRMLREAAATGRLPGRAELDDCRAAGALAASGACPCGHWSRPRWRRPSR
ncbi:hypothetical protein [Streptosporangium sp. NPDC006930]|uniref:hypothetical protein n=1 Tax=Streptosporangium sp. NPDC006930 TaxID=3154783 RepID=UPI00341BF06F